MNRCLNFLGQSKYLTSRLLSIMLIINFCKSNSIAVPILYHSFPPVSIRRKFLSLCKNNSIIYLVSKETQKAFLFWIYYAVQQKNTLVASYLYYENGKLNPRTNLRLGWRNFLQVHCEFLLEAVVAAFKP